MNSDQPAPRGITTWLPRTSVGRPVTVVMLLIALLILGAVSLSRLPVQMMPDGFDPPFMMVFVPFPGANPSEVEDKIIKPLEDQLFTVRGIEELNCQASGDSGRCWMQFLQSIEMEDAYNEVADRIERLSATTWPEEVERVRIRRFNPADDAPLKIAITIPASMDDPYWFLRTRVAQRLERVPGVAQVDLEGVYEKQIFIEPDRDKIESHKISLWQMVQSLREANFALSTGDLEDGGRRLLVRSVARFDTIEEISRLPIRDDGLRLGDVATVRYAHPPPERAGRLDGKPAAMIEVFKESSANTVEVTSAAIAEMETISREEKLLEAAGGFQILFDQGEVIGESIRQLRDAGLIGGLFAIIILYFFMRRARVTFLITLAIPVSLLSALVVMYLAGKTLNLVSLMGMIICTGMLVDNAVVVSENIDRYRRSGMAPRKAALRGAAEVSLALTMATITTMAVFLPMILMSEEGMMRFFLLELSVPIIFSIAASLVVALLFVPLAASRLLRDDTTHRPKGPNLLSRSAERVYRLVMDPLHRFYLRALDFALLNRGLVLVIVVATVGATYWPYQGTETSLQGRRQQGGRQVSFWFNLPNSYGLEQADKWFQKVEQAFDQEREALDIRHLRTRFWHNRGMVHVILENADLTDVSVEEATERLKEVVPTAPGVKLFVNWQRGSGSDASISVSLYGEDTATLAVFTEEAERRLRTLDGLISVEPDLENALEEVRIRIDRERALRYGIRPEVITGTVATALRGQRLPRYRDGEKEVEILVQFPERERQGIRRLASMHLPSASGKPIPLEAVADLNITRGYGDIRRRDRRTVLNIKLNTTRSSLRDLRSAVSATMNQLELPRGYTWDFGSRMRWERQDLGNLFFGLGLSIVFIYLIMGLLFESVLLPLAVMPSILLSWIGVFWLLWATNTKLDMMAAIGLVLLAGLVVNNGIVLVDLINHLRSTGMSRQAAILEAGRLRFRPILMTALTTIFGMLPMTLGRANFVGIPYAGLGRTFVGGLLSSTTLTLIVVPVFYTVLDDLAGILRHLFTGRTTSPVRYSAADADVGLKHPAKPAEM